MGITLERFQQDSCCLCGSTKNLTGEHKIKASALKAEFGNDKLVVGRFGEPNDRLKFAQSVRSSALHFTARVCSPCNSAVTQAPDKQFDRFHRAARALLADGADPQQLFLEPQYQAGSEAYLDVFRYFAKLLCCHIAELGAPRFLRIARFATGQSHANCIWLSIDEDWTYKRVSGEFGSYQYAAHGGLVVYGDKRSGAPNAFHSTLTVGPLRYVFFSRLNWVERLELQFAHREFYDWCRQQVRLHINNPISAEDRLKLGLATEETLAAELEVSDTTLNPPRTQTDSPPAPAR